VNVDELQLLLTDLPAPRNARWPKAAESLDEFCDLSGLPTGDSRRHDCSRAGNSSVRHTRRHAARHPSRKAPSGPGKPGKPDMRAVPTLQARTTRDSFRRHLLNWRMPAQPVNQHKSWPEKDINPEVPRRRKPCWTSCAVRFWSAGGV